MKTLFKLIEPRTFTASLLPVVYASVYAYSAFGRLSWVRLFFLALGMVLVQGATNMLNDYFDYKRAADQGHLADEKALVSGEVTPKQLKGLIQLFIAGALTIGLYYSVTMSWWILLVIVVAMTVLYRYSAGPRPICYTPFGETAAGLTMGFGITVTSIYIQSGVFSIMTVLTALPMVIFIGALLMANNLSDWEADLVAGRKTSVILLGAERGAKVWQNLLYAMLVTGLLLTFLGIYSPAGYLLIVLTFPYKMLHQAAKAPKGRTSKGLFMGTSSMVGLRFHLAAMAGLLMVKLVNLFMG